jgi:hypothetical protein
MRRADPLGVSTAPRPPQLGGPPVLLRVDGQAPTPAPDPAV